MRTHSQSRDTLASSCWLWFPLVHLRLPGSPPQGEANLSSHKIIIATTLSKSNPLGLRKSTEVSELLLSAQGVNPFPTCISISSPSCNKENCKGRVS